MRVAPTLRGLTGLGGLKMKFSTLMIAAAILVSASAAGAAPVAGSATLAVKPGNICVLASTMGLPISCRPR